MVNEKGTIIDRREMLRIKLMSLVAEVRIIRKEERSVPQALADEMREHRRTVIRAVSRDTHLALGFLRGRSYGQLEPIHYSDPSWERVSAMIKKYGPVFTHMDMAVLDALIKHWRENPSWKAPDLHAMKQEYRSQLSEKQSSESSKGFWKRQSEITLMSVAQSKMAA